MSCIQYGFTIQGDVNNKLAKSVDVVAGVDYTKAQVLAGYFGTEVFVRDRKCRWQQTRGLNILQRSGTIAFK